MYKFHTIYVRCLTVVVTLLLAATCAAEPSANFRFDPEDCLVPGAVSEHHTEAVAQFEAAIPDGFWSDNDRLQSLIDHLGLLGDDGLNPGDYYLTALGEIKAFQSTWNAILPCDSRLASHVYLMALSDLHFGRIPTHDKEQLWYSPIFGERHTAPDMLALANWDIATGFDQARPTLDRYVHLRTAYQQARTKLPDQWPTIAEGPTLEEGQRSERVVSLKERLSAEGYLDANTGADGTADLFDAAVTDAIKAFQRHHYLAEDGKVGAQTLSQLNVQPTARLDQIRTNLERLRWLAADMEDRLLLVDIAAARIEFYRDGQVAWTTRAQVGKPLRETPRLKSVITHVTVNPTWTIPTTIFLKDQLPRIRRNPTYLSDRRIRIFDQRGNELDEASVDWSKPEGLLLRQDPGRNNALGEVVIRFSNPYAVYLHDTPSSGLFNTTNRFYSSGCVRVEDAMKLTELLFQGHSPQAWRDLQAIRASGETRNVQLPRSYPVLLAYWTAEADEQGNLYFRPDPYQGDLPLYANLEQE